MKLFFIILIIMYIMIISSNGQLVLNDDGTLSSGNSNESLSNTNNLTTNADNAPKKSESNDSSIIKTIVTYCVMGVMALFMIVMIWYMCFGKSDSNEKNIRMDSDLILLKNQQNVILERLEKINDNVNSQGLELKRRNSAGSISVVTATGDKYEVPFPSDASFSILPKGI